MWLLALGLAVALAGVILVPTQLLAQSGAPASDPAGHWSAGPAMLTARTEVAAVEAGGLLHVVGGYPGGDAPPDTHEVYDPRTGAWSFKQALPVGLHHACAASIDGRLYIVGGYFALGPAVNSLYAYDAAADA